MKKKINKKEKKKRMKNKIMILMNLKKEMESFIQFQ